MFGLIQLFRSDDPDPLPTLSIIGDDTTIHGDTIEGTGDLRIEGTIHADIVREGRVVVAPDGAVHGTVQAESIHVAGTVRGELHAEATLVLGASSDVEARLQADALTIESGADFKGMVHDGAVPVVPSLEAMPSGDHRPPPVLTMGLSPTLEADAPAKKAEVPREPDSAANEEFVSVWDEE
jgi:cytoskeletal protein CcmA (bactofilin family)